MCVWCRWVEWQDNAGRVRYVKIRGDGYSMEGEGE
jgi:hypothetical protein